MPETLILHLGLHKTATTALQDFLAGEARALVAHGVACPRLARMRSDLTPLIASAAKPDRAALGRFVDKVPQPVLLLSDENILGAPGDILGGALYPYAENRVRRFCDQFAGRRIRLFLTLREPAAFLASMYCEYLRHNPWLGFADYARGLDLAAEIAGRADPKTAQIFLNMLDSRDRRFGATRFEPLAPERAAALAAGYDRDLATFAGLRAA